MISRRWLAAFEAGAFALAGITLAGTVADSGVRTHVVGIEGMNFHPAAVAAQPGDTVRWVNHDLVPHTATRVGGWDTGSIVAGAGAVFVPRRPGRYDYQCTFHPVMRATLIVRSPSH